MRRIKKKEENNMSTTKTYQMPNKWLYLTCMVMGDGEGVGLVMTDANGFLYKSQVFH